MNGCIHPRYRAAGATASQLLGGPKLDDVAAGTFAHSHPLPVIDGLLAATAQTYGFTLVTRNVKDFRRSGAWVLNPFMA